MTQITLEAKIARDLLKNSEDAESALYRLDEVENEIVSLSENPNIDGLGEL